MLKTKLTFFDDYWLDFRIGTVRRWYAPVYQGHFRDPDYTGGTFCSTIFRDEATQTYKLFYYGAPDAGSDLGRQMCLAESKDGIHFTPSHVGEGVGVTGKPVVCDCRRNVSLECATEDFAETDPAKRFKATGLYVPPGTLETPKLTMVTASSPDAIHWNIDFDNPAHPTTSDADNNILYNPHTGEYMLFFRAGYVDRRICCKTSRDLKTWTDAVVSVHPGAGYNDEAYAMQLYGMVPWYSDGIFYAFMQRFYTSLTDMDYGKMFGFVEPELYYSYDGRQWMPTSGKSLVQRNQAPDYGSTAIYLMGACESFDGREWIISGTGSRIIHGTGATNKALSEALHGEAFGAMVYKMRKDGFCGIEGLGAGSRVITKAMHLTEPEITVNLNAACGFARFALLKKNGDPIEGFSFDDCDPVKFDDVMDHKLTWKDHTLDEVLNTPVRIAVELNGAVLHTLTVTAHPCIRRPQASFADPNQLLD